MPGIFRETVCFEIVGGSVERFLNIANRRWLNVFNVNHRDGKAFAFTDEKEFPALSKVIKEIDPKAFMSVSPTHNVYGEGFDEIKTGIKTSRKKNAAD